MRKAICILIFLLIHASVLVGQELLIPDHHSLVDSISGDLDKDSNSELVVVYNVGPDDEAYGYSRQLIIYKLKDSKWTEWKKSDQALFSSKDGGMMGDPFDAIEIENSVLLIRQRGGSGWKWGLTNKYRFQNGEFYLIGYSSNYGSFCKYWQVVDFNLITGKIVVTREYEECEEQGQRVLFQEKSELLADRL